MTRRTACGAAAVLILAACVAKSETGVGTAPANILANSDFREAGVSEAQPRWWAISEDDLAAGRVLRLQASTNSEARIVRAGPDSYPVMRQPVLLTAGRKYTVKVVARCRSGDSTLGVCQLGFGGSVRQILWQTTLTREFRPYVRTFTAVFGMNAICVYNVSPAGGAVRGTLDLACVYLYDGEYAESAE